MLFNRFSSILRHPGYNDPITMLAGGSVVSGVLGAVASSSAADTQAQAANNASAAQMQMFNTINQQQAPYRQAGVNALNQLSYLTGGSPSSGSTSQATPLTQAQWQQSQPQSGNNNLNGSLLGAFTGQNYSDLIKQYVSPSQNNNGQTYQDYVNSFYAQNPQTSSGTTLSISDPTNLLHSFNTSDLTTNLAPSYDFMLNQGLSTNKNLANSTGGLIGGNALQGLNNYAQNYASTGYQQAYNNYNTNQTNIYNRLAGIAGIGQIANQSTANAGQAATTASSNYLTSGAAAQAAGIVGSTNALTSGLNNAMGWNYLSSLSSGGSGSGG